MSLNFYCKEEENSREESINKYKNIFKNYEKKTPSLSEALNQMFRSAELCKEKITELTEDIINQCKDRIDPDFDSIKKKYENITKEDAYIICSYTCESGIDRTYSPYRILNQNLVSNDRQNGVKNISQYLYIFLKSLRKLPKYYPENKVLYRCLTCQVNLSEGNNNIVPYKIGNKKTFWGFTSTSSDVKMTFSFLKKEENNKTGTIFSLSGDIWGYNIEPFNWFHEKEILLEPERKFIISNVIPPVNNDIINITCNILDTNLILSDNKLESNLNYTKEDENKDNMSISEYLIKFEMETKINNENKYTEGIGILCNIPLKNIKALITYNHMLNFDFLNKGEKMLLYINKKEKEINIRKNRYKYTNEDLDITIIEILDEDNIIKFIEIDKFINSKNYIDSEIVSVTLKKDKQLELLDGMIIGKNDDNYECNIESLKKGIIVLKDNMKLIGIIKEKDERMIIIPMNTIINKINFIKCVYEIENDDIGKDIQIINYMDKNVYELKNEEIQKQVKIIIFGEIESNILKYKFNKEGEYIIYLISYKDLRNMSYMFYDCSSLKELNLSSFNTNQVTNMAYMFDGCSSLKELNLSSLNTNHVTDMYSMFNRCSSIKELNLSSFDTNQVTYMSFMFCECSSLKELNLSSFNTNQVTEMIYMFGGCSSLKKLNLSLFNTNQVTNMHSMFDGCSSLEELNLSSFDTNQVTDMSRMFRKCSSLEELDLSSFNTDKVTIMSKMFNGCSSLEELILSSFNTNQVTDMSKMFRNCSSLEELHLSSFVTNQVTDMSKMFRNCSSLEVLDLSQFDTNHVKNMSFMFCDCTSLKELNLSSFNTNQVTDMSLMFYNCSTLKELNLSSFNINQVTDMHSMFDGCFSLKELNLSSFNSNQAINISLMFDSINKKCKIKCKDKQILQEFKNSTGCIII